jgi:hypothetical protein
MENIKYFNEYITENFNLDEYGDKRYFVMTVIPKLISKLEPLNKFGERIFYKIVYQDGFGSYVVTNNERKYGFDFNLMYEIYNKLNDIKYFIEPKLSGEFKMIKKTIWQKLFNKPKLYVVEGSSIIDHLIKLIPEFKDELRDIEKDKLITDITSKIWNIHPNNPKNKIDESKINEGLYNKEQLNYDEYIIHKATSYKKLTINLSNLILKYKQDIINDLNPYMKYIDEKVYKSLLLKIDEFYDYLNGVNKKEKSVVELLDIYINKENYNK